MELLSGIFMGGGQKMKRLAEFSQSDGFCWCCTALLRCRLCIFTSCREERIAIDEALKSAGRVDVMTMVSPAGTSHRTGTVISSSGAVRLFPGKGSRIEGGTESFH